MNQEYDFEHLPKGVIIKQWESYIDNLGMLLPIHFNELPFTPVRVFSVNNVPAGATRGGHAHHKTRQYILCLKGKVKVLTTDKDGKKEFMLMAGQGTLIDKLTWDSQRFMTGDEQLLVFCSTEYDRSDYISDIDEFKKLIGK